MATDTDTLWIRATSGVLKTNPHDGSVLQEVTVPTGITQIAVDPNARRLWALDSLSNIYAFEADGTQHLSVPGPGLAYALVVDEAADRIWIAAGTDVFRYDTEGVELGSAPLMATALTLDRAHARLWVATSDELVVLEADGTEIYRVSTGCFSAHTPIAYDPSVDQVWLADGMELRRYDIDDGLVFQQNYGPLTLFKSISVDGQGGLWAVTPAELLHIDSSGTLEFRLTPFFGEVFSLIEDQAARSADGSVWVASAKRIKRYAMNGQLLADFALGISIGNIRALQQLALHHDTEPPSLWLTDPAEGSYLNTAFPVLSFEFSDRGSGVDPATILCAYDDIPVAVSCDVFGEGSNTQCQPDVPLPEGGMLLSATIADQAGNRSEPEGVNVTVDTIAPVIQVTSFQDGAIVNQPTQELAGSVSEAASVTINGVAVSAGAQNEFTHSIRLAHGENRFTVVATDRAGNSSSKTLSITLEYVPPDPQTIAPPFDPAVLSTVYDSTAFLYEGSNPIQPDVEPGAIAYYRAAAIRGRAITRAGTPLSGVVVTVLDHAEFGWTGTRADGLFDMAVNGGGVLTVNYEKAGYLPVQRKVDVPWQDYARVADVVMIPLDSRVTTIDFDAPDPIQVARGNPVSDSDGTRQATLLFTQGTGAQLIMPDGSTQSITKLNARATEYTVGSNGPKTMPGDLPPTSGYTYAVELSTDEAMAAGAGGVRFDRPVYLYVENFLGFPEGSDVPAGWYDRDRATWIPSDNGRVVKVLSISNGLAELDVDGSGNPATSEALGVLGITDEERRKLADLYAPGQSLWRTPVTHFTPWDCNWPYGPPADAQRPNPPPPEFDKKEDDPCEQGGSIIECQNQVLGEALPIIGSPFSLHYRSNRGPGREADNVVKIPLSGETLPASVRRIDLEVSIAGREFENSFPATPNQSYTLTWDGKDLYGRTVNGGQKVTIRVGYAYPATYYSPASLGSAFSAPGVSGATFSAIRARQEIVIWSEYRSGYDLGASTVGLGAWNAQQLGLGGWTISPQHVYDPTSRILHLGDGGKLSAYNMSSGIETVAGNGELGATGDGGLATEATLGVNLEGVTVGLDGSLYIADHSRVRRVDPNGIIRTVAGGSNQPSSGIGDGGPATQAYLDAAKNVAVGSDGSLYISELYAHRVRRVDQNGIITTFAGTGTQGFSGDGGPAVQAQLYHPRGLVVGPDGSVYIADEGNKRVRRVTPDGMITTYAGDGTKMDNDQPGCSVWNGTCGDGGPALQASLGYVKELAMKPDGTLYVTTQAPSRVRQVGTDGTIDSAAHSGVGTFTGIAVSPQGDVYFNYTYTSTEGNVYRINKDGSLTIVAGKNSGGFSGDGGPATQAEFKNAQGLAAAPDGSLYIMDALNYRVRRVVPTLTGLAEAVKYIASDDGQSIYAFDFSGRHLHTLDAMTGVVRYAFAYDTTGYLVGITDRDGNITTIERDAAGKPLAIIAPHGQRTELHLDGHGYLDSVQNPAGEIYQMVYTADGLLSRFTDPKGNSSTFGYDELGRLVSDTNAANGGWTLARSKDQNVLTVSLASAEGRTTQYRVERLVSGVRNYTNTSPYGTVNTTVMATNGQSTFTAANGTETVVREGPDPRFGVLAPLVASQSVTTPGGLSYQSTTEADASLADPEDLLSVTELSRSTTRNGRTYTSRYTAATRSLLSTTPAGRIHSATLDAKGHVVSTQFAGLQPSTYGYDARGRLVSLTQGAAGGRVYRFDYNPQGHVERVTDPLDRSTSFTYDAAGRVLGKTLPDGRVIRLDYDPNGNLTAVQPPDGTAHVFSYTPVDLEEQYTPPALAGVQTITNHRYNLDKQLVGIDRPDGASVELGYDSGGRLSTVTLPRGQYQYAYTAANQLDSITAPDGGTLSYGWDGSLPLSETWTGEIGGSVGRSYDNNFWVTGRTVNGQTVGYGYDDDGLLTSAGALTLTRDPQTGLVTDTALGGVSTSSTYNDFGELASETVTADGNTRMATDYSRDALGRITGKAETLDGVTTTYGYAYDASGRLSAVERNGAVVSTYSYDANGNRLSHTGPGGTRNGSYDAQDRLTQYGTASHAYTANGELRSKTESGATTNYTYDELGNLLRVTLPGDLTLDYRVDGRNRRIGKQVNGVLVQGFLYRDKLNLVAELDGGGNVVSRFVYAHKTNIPAYMEKGGKTYRIVSDHLGSPRLVVDAQDGSIVQRMDYDEYGNVVLDSNPGFQPFGFAGGIYDLHTGLVRFGARDYDAGTGRWTGKDPIGFKSKGYNLYAYVGGNPINFIDPKGLETTVTVWQPVGWGSSSFGHVSTSINGTTYSFGPNGMSVLPTSDYLSRNDFRSGVGSNLNLTPEQEARLQACMSGSSSSYNTVANNCGAPIQDCLKELGHDLGWNVFPVSVGNSLLDSGVVTGFEFYSPTTPATGTSAPWAK